MTGPPDRGKRSPEPVGVPHPVAPIHLPSLDDAERAEVLEQLRGWVTELIDRFDITARVIPPCWEQHNGMVEALLALRDLERDCYAETAAASAGVDWFRGYREIEARLIELASLTNCSVHEHRTPPRAWPSRRPAPTTTEHAGQAAAPRASTIGAPDGA